jgi:hypothetical protein
VDGLGNRCSCHSSHEERSGVDHVVCGGGEFGNEREFESVWSHYMGWLLGPLCVLETVML